MRARFRQLAPYMVSFTGLLLFKYKELTPWPLARGGVVAMTIGMWHYSRLGFLWDLKAIALS